MMTLSPAWLVLADGSVFEGISVGSAGYTIGELVFNTAMTGYQEILTDPSYTQQIVLMTAAHIGNTGVNAEDMESSRIWASGLVVRDMTCKVSHYRSEETLPSWLKKNHVVAISGVDTRALTLHLREHGVQQACITTEPDLKKAHSALQHAKPLSGLNLAKTVTRQIPERWDKGLGSWAVETKPARWHVVVYDFGVKHQILKILHDQGCHVTIVPMETPVNEVLALNPDGIVLSNGPGDPAACDVAIAHTRVLLEQAIPLLGICLGFQILALATGAQIVKMSLGHHGANHPVIETTGLKRVLITSQNHGFMVDEHTLPACVQITHRSLFDGTLQGFRWIDRPVIGFQGHPEAGPGPHDLLSLFDEWIALIQQFKNKR